jgi:pimeloyl-ACP methyl ester carboxylesterase
MPTNKINGIDLYWEMLGNDGEPLVLVHGSWGDHHNWDTVSGELSKTFRVVTFDRRGHSKSERPPHQGNAEEDVSDLIALIEYLDISPSHIVGNSAGAAIVLKTAARNPGVFKSLAIHEPPLFGLLKNMPEAQTMLQVVNSRVRAVVELIASGKHAEAAKLFAETIAIGPNSWQHLPDEVKQTFIYNAPTFLDEIHDPDNPEFDVRKLESFDKPALFSNGTESPPFFTMVLEKIAKALPMSHPEQFVRAVKDFAGYHKV